MSKALGRTGGRGRPTEAELRRVRELVERMHLAGYPTERIRTELAALKDRPIETTVTAIKEHIKAIRKGWLDRTNESDTLRADMVGQTLGVMHSATAGMAAKRGTTLEVAYAKLILEAGKAIERLAGMDVKRLEVSGPNGAPLVISPHPIEVLPPKQLAARMRAWAVEMDEDEE